MKNQNQNTKISFNEVLDLYKRNNSDINMPDSNEWNKNQNVLYSKIENIRKVPFMVVPSLSAATVILTITFISILSFNTSNIDSFIQDDTISMAAEYLDNDELAEVATSLSNESYSELFGVNTESAEDYLVSEMYESEIISYLSEDKQDDFIQYMYDEYNAKVKGEV